MTLRLYNTLARGKQDFDPLDPANVRMYECGPTVYDHAHIGNARPVIVFDVLYRLLRHLYGADHVTYARNITDVDDKIIARARADHPGMPLNEAIDQVTTETGRQFHEDVAALGCLAPTIEPRATGHVPQMIAMIGRLIDKGHAYVAQRGAKGPRVSPQASPRTGSARQGADGAHVLFAVKSFDDYGKLARRSTDEMVAGARVEVAPYKQDPMDFVLWKPSAPDEPGWESPWGRGRPGWHIECSAMSDHWLWEQAKPSLTEAGLGHPHMFDIHGGGIDLVFPHHENEIAQSRCAHGSDIMANIWMHNGFLQVEGRKMAKSEGNFVTIRELLETDAFGGRKWPGEVLRLAMLMTHYRQPIDWTVERVAEAAAIRSQWIQLGEFFEINCGDVGTPPESVLEPMVDDLNTPAAFSEMHKLAQHARLGDSESAHGLCNAAQFFGVISEHSKSDLVGLSAESSVILQQQVQIESSLQARNAARAAKNFAEADRIRDELAEMGIRLKDGKDPETGEPVTTWEVAR